MLKLSQQRTELKEKCSRDISIIAVCNVIILRPEKKKQHEMFKKLFKRKGINESKFFFLDRQDLISTTTSKDSLVQNDLYIFPHLAITVRHRVEKGLPILLYIFLKHWNAIRNAPVLQCTIMRHIYVNARLEFKHVFMF